jgi:hypothetical protein
VMVRSRLSILVVAVLIATLLSFPAPGSTRSWRNVINDQFTAGTRVPAHWGLYNGRYGSGQRNCASPRQVFVNSHGYLVLRESYRRTGKCGAGWYTGGMKIAAAYKGVDQRITLRFRRVGAIHSHRNIPMFWDSDDRYSAHQVEADFCEGESSTGCATFLHYAATNRQISHAYTVDQNTWHTYRFIIRDHLVRAFVDGRVRWDYHGTSFTIPDARRRLVLQQECAYTGTHTCPKGTTGQERIQIDWLKLDHLVSS